jgi:hypothetical protein
LKTANLPARILPMARLLLFLLALVLFALSVADG